VSSCTYSNITSGLHQGQHHPLRLITISVRFLNILPMSFFSPFPPQRIIVIRLFWHLSVTQISTSWTLPYDTVLCFFRGPNRHRSGLFVQGSLCTHHHSSHPVIDLGLFIVYLLHLVFNSSSSWFTVHPFYVILCRLPSTTPPARYNHPNPSWTSSWLFVAFPVINSTHDATSFFASYVYFRFVSSSNRWVLGPI
jgi:hypothetical protein